MDATRLIRTPKLTSSSPHNTRPCSQIGVLLTTKFLHFYSFIPDLFCLHKHPEHTQVASHSANIARLILLKPISNFVFLFYALFLLALTAAQNAVPSNPGESPENYPYSSLPPAGDILSYGENHTAHGACAAYNETIDSYASQQEQTLAPLCIIEPTTPLEAAKTVFVLSYLAENIQSTTDCRFAVKGGGQTALAGSANIDSGVVIDLHNLNSVDVTKRVAVVNADPSDIRNTTVVNIGGGATWDQVYQKLDPLSLSVTGGGTAGVGVGGLTLGGGISPFSPKNGWACNNVVNFEIILSYGNWINVNFTSYPALVLSLRGGGSNYGIVTRFDFFGFPMTNLWGGEIRYPIETIEAQTSALMNFAGANPYDTNASVSSQIIYSSETGLWSVLNSLYYTAQPALVNASALLPFTSIQPQLSNTMRVTSMSGLAEESRPSAPGRASRKSTITGTVQPSGDTATTLFRIANLTSQDILNVPGFSLSLHFDPIPLVMRENGNAHGPNEMGGFNGPDSLIIWYTEYSWSNEEDDGKIAIAASDMLQQAEIDAAIINRANPFICLNVAGSGQSPFQSYGADYQTWLEGAAKLYDPSGVFQKVMPGGFKVFDDTPVFNPAPVFGGT